MPKASDTSSVQKVCRILRTLSVPDALRLSEVALATGLNKATVLRLLDELADEGFVERDEASKRYRLGEQAMLLGFAAQGRDTLRDRARPWLMRLAGLSGDTVLLSVRSGVEAVCIERETGTYPIRANYLDVGSRRPLGVGAGSLALLAWMPDAEVDAVLELTRSAITERYPRIDEALLRAKIAESRRQGHVLLLDVVVERMGGIGLPILGIDGRPVGAISIAALNERLITRRDLLVATMREAVDALSPNPVAQAALEPASPRVVDTAIHAASVDTESAREDAR
ncbi:MAG: IclR family transcriptional regulator [Burkholderiaceae bacterium]